MPDPRHPSDRTAAARQADHASLSRLSDTLVPALVAKLSTSGLGELEIHEGDWRIRLRRTPHAAPARRSERARPNAPVAAERPATPHAASAPTSDRRRGVATAPTVGVFKAIAQVGARVRTGDRIATVDLLGIPQDVVAPIDGTVVEVFVQTGEAVEYGEEIAAVEAPAELRDPDDDGSEEDGS